MDDKLKISDTGLKLIKAYEGYRPVDRELITGQRIVGYGHRLYNENAVRMTKAEAEEILRIDLEPFEDMINTEVHAPLTQSQFDALCSFAFNIGPRAFLTSDTLRALNNGRPLDAANGFDIWRKSQISGKTYVVDALMRRRTAEKALFLRTEGDLPAGREDLPPIEDTTIKGLSTEDALPVFSSDDANGIVASAPFDAASPQFRRREDGPAGPLASTEVEIDDDEKLETLSLEEPIMQLLPEDEIIDPDIVEETDELESENDDEIVSENEVMSERTSPIAEAATDIIARLDALIEDAGEADEAVQEDWPDSLIETDEISETTRLSGNVVEMDPDNKGVKIANEMGLSEKEPDLVIDELAQDDATRTKLDVTSPRSDSAAKYVQQITSPDETPDVESKTGAAGLWIPVILGFLLLGPSVAAYFKGAEQLIGEWGPTLVFAGAVIGLFLITMGIYAALRIKSKN